MIVLLLLMPKDARISVSFIQGRAGHERMAKGGNGGRKFQKDSNTHLIERSPEFQRGKVGFRFEKFAERL